MPRVKQVTRRGGSSSFHKRKVQAQDSDDDVNVSKKSKTVSSADGQDYPTSVQTDEEGNEFWQISKTRRVTVQPFNKKLYVNIREYYETDGQLKPGKKGIMLPIDQFSSIISLLPDIENVLATKGEKVSRPSYDGTPSKSAKEHIAGSETVKETAEIDNDDEDEDQEDEEDDE